MQLPNFYQESDIDADFELQQITFNNALEELKENLGLHPSSTIADVAEKATFEDMVDTGIFHYMPKLAENGFFKYHGKSITLQDILTIISDNDSHIVNEENISRGPYQTLIWWLREMKKNGIVFVHDNNQRQDGTHPFDLAAKIGDFFILKIIARYCPIRDENNDQGFFGKQFKPRFGNPAHNFLAYWLGLGHQFFPWFLQKGFNVNDTNSNGRPIVIIAAEKDCPDFDELLWAGPNVEAIDPRTGQTALHLYALNGLYRDELKDLITPNTINHRDNLGQTPLFYAINNVHTWQKYVKEQEDRISYRFCKILIEAGADTTIMNNAGNTPLDVFNAMEPKYDALASLFNVKLEKLYFDDEEDIYDENGNLREGVSEEREAKYLELLGEANEELNKTPEESFRTRIAEMTMMKTPEGDNVISKELVSWVQNVFYRNLPSDLFESIQINGLIQGGLGFSWKIEGFGDIGFTAFNDAKHGHYFIGNYQHECDISDEANVIHVLSKIHTAIEEAIH